MTADCDTDQLISAIVFTEAYGTFNASWMPISLTYFDQYDKEVLMRNSGVPTIVNKDDTS